jgi:lipoprotein Spr
MNLRRTLVFVVIFTSIAVSAIATPDNKNVKKDSTKSKKEIWTKALKESVQFNYGIPLTKKSITATKKFTTPKDEGVSYYNWIQRKFAKKMDVHPSEVANEPLYNFINEWYGTRYVYGGTSKRGIDCSSFVQKLIRATYNINMQRTAANQKRTTKYIGRDQLQEGDLVFFKIKVHRISHVGVYLQNNHFVHASSSRGVMISNLNSSYWSRYYAGGGRVNP